MNKKLLLIFFIGMPLFLCAQISFTDSSSNLVNSSLTSGVAIGVCDMNGDGLDDIVRLNNASDLEIEYQSLGGVFTRLDYGDLGTASEWGLAISDVDGNGYNDIVAGGNNNNIKLLIANSNGTDYSITNLTPSIFVQNINFADIDNNGTSDIFVCNDIGLSSPYNNNGSGVMTYDLGLINPISTVPSDNSGNYGSIWTDYDNDGDLDLYIAKCRIGVSDPDDGRRLNQLFQNDGNGNYTDVAAARGLLPKRQSWSAGFEDIDNDGDFDCIIINHDLSSQIFENDGSGNFTDITASSGIATELNDLGSDGIQVILEDFDNDTFVDLFITSRGNDNHILFQNNGDKTFTEVSSPFPNSSETIQSAATGDLNNDGFIDVIAGFADGYNGPTLTSDILYLNNGNSNNWSKIKLNGDTSNTNGIGARIEIEGSWGTQVREVRSGESYGTMNSLITHFGLGSASAITKLTIKWPSGTEDVFLNPSINSLIEIDEGESLSVTNFEKIEFTVFPNPVKDKIKISGNQVSTVKTVKIFDLTGKLVLSYNPSFLSNTIELDLENLTQGLYLIKLSTVKNDYTYKLIKQ